MNTFYHGDCLFVMDRDIEPGSVDLIYLDPPFFTGKIQKAKDRWHPEAMEISFEDRKSYWAKHLETMQKNAPLWLSDIGDRRPEFAAYLYYMMERLQACKRVLKSTGSIYLHCDWRASHYLKMIMDGLFGDDNFKSDIIWYRPNKIPDTTKRLFYKTHDNILFYAKTSDYIFHPLKTPTGQMIRRRKMKKIKGRIVNTDDYIKYERQEPKTRSVIIDIPDINISQITKTSERTGYPTQKPIGLLERIILASSNEGDIILDPFCGCGTAIIAAHKNNRRWIGIDINRAAYDTTKGRETQLPLGMAEGFATATFITRNLESVKRLPPNEFESWVNEFFGATKPSPDAGVDGITRDGIPIQTKARAYKVNDSIVRQFSRDIELHPSIKSLAKHGILVSQSGFENNARSMAFTIQTKFGITIELKQPEELLKISI